MADSRIYVSSSRIPLQESKNQQNNVMRPTGTNPNSIAKLGQENYVPSNKVVSTASLMNRTGPPKGAGATGTSHPPGPDNRDIQKSKSALQQRPPSNNLAMMHSKPPLQHQGKNHQYFATNSKLKGRTPVQNGTEVPAFKQGFTTKLTGPMAAPGLTRPNFLAQTQPRHELSQSSPQPAPQVQQSAQSKPQPQQELPIATQDQSSAKTYGSAEWKHQVQQVLPTYRFYFDCVEPALANQFSKRLAKLRSNVSKFFSSEVTHIVTTSNIPSKSAIERIKSGADANTSATQNGLDASSAVPAATKLLPENSIIVKAVRFGIKIWSVERLDYLLRPFFGHPGANQGNLDLQDFLLREKVYGLPTGQGEDTSRSDFYVFKRPFLLVEDLSGHYQPVIAYEYPETPDPNPSRPPWPKIYHHTTDHSPFTFVDEGRRHKSQAAKAPHDEQPAQLPVNKDKEPEKAADQPDELQQGHSAVVSGFVNSVTSNMLSTTSAIGKIATPQVAQDIPDRLFEQLGKRILNASKAEAGVGPDLKKVDIIRPAANATPPPRLTNTTDRHLQVSSKNLVLAEKEPLNIQAVILDVPATPQDQVKDENVPKDPNQAATQALQNDPSATRTHKDRRKLHYCENCRHHFYDWDEHLESPRHKSRAQDMSRFAQLDDLLSQLERKPRLTPRDNNNPATSEPLKHADNSSTKVLKNSTPKPKGTRDGKVEAPKETQISKSDLTQRTNRGEATALGKAQPCMGDKQTQPGQIDRLNNPTAGLVALIAETGVDLDVNSSVAHKTINLDNQDKLEIVANPDLIADQEDDDICKELSSELSRLDVSEIGEEDEQDEDQNDEGGEESALPHSPEQESDMTDTTDTTHTTPVLERGSESEKNFSYPSLPPKTLLKRLVDDRSIVNYSDQVLNSDVTASHAETDPTQPDDRFLDQPTSTLTTDIVQPIQLAINLTSVYTDGPEPVEMPSTQGKEETPTSGRIIVIESDREGSADDDDVDLLKSPSAGRGTFARTQAESLRRSLFQASSISTGGLSTGESLKRRFEQVLEEERTMDITPGPISFRPDQRGFSRATASADCPSSGMYSQTVPQQPQFQHLSPMNQSNQQMRPTAATRPVSWHNSSPFVYQNYVSSSPQRPMYSPSPLQERQLATEDEILHTAPILRSRDSGFGVVQEANFNYPNVVYNANHGSMGFNAESTRHHTVAHDYRSAHPNSPAKPRKTAGQAIAIPQARQESYYSQAELRSPHAVHGYQHHRHQYPSSTIVPDTRPTSPTSPMSYLSAEEPHSARHYGEYDQYSSPSSAAAISAGRSRLGRQPMAMSMSQQSPRYQPLMVMSHAEQEQERCYHHYRGDRLPEPAGQKKLRSTSSLDDELEEYGEG
ncbi:hypothetical protein BGW38_010875, partial [Lunasporangiospora selenospora]